jgi:hypothetical protein
MHCFENLCRRCAGQNRPHFDDDRVSNRSSDRRHMAGCNLGISPTSVIGVFAVPRLDKKTNGCLRSDACKTVGLRLLLEFFRY